jgi:hypothetical protein
MQGILSIKMSNTMSTIMSIHMSRREAIGANVYFQVPQQERTLALSTYVRTDTT